MSEVVYFFSHNTDAPLGIMVKMLLSWQPVSVRLYIFTDSHQAEQQRRMEKPVSNPDANLCQLDPISVPSC